MLVPDYIDNHHPMRPNPLLFVMALWLSLGAFAQTNVVVAPSQATVSITLGDVPVITSPISADGTLGTAFNYQITGAYNPTSFGASGLPTGLTVNPATGLISGTPTAFGVFYVTVNTTNATDTYSTTIAINITNYADSDGDGVNDSWEMSHYGNLTTCTTTSRNNLDGLLDRDEYRLGLDPTKNNLTAPANKTSYVYNLRNELTQCTVPVTGVVLTFNPDAEGNVK